MSSSVDCSLLFGWLWGKITHVLWVSVFLSIKVKNPSKQFHLTSKCHVSMMVGLWGTLGWRDLPLDNFLMTVPKCKHWSCTCLMSRLISTSPIEYIYWVEMKLNHGLYNHLWGFSILSILQPGNCIIKLMYLCTFPRICLCPPTYAERECLGLSNIHDSLALGPMALTQQGG